MAEDTKSGVLEGNETFVGVDEIYQNAAVEADAPRYPEDGEERELYERFAESPEGEVVSNYGSKKDKAEAKEEKKEAPKPSSTPATPATPTK